MKRPDLAARNRGDGGIYEDADWCRARYVDDGLTLREMAAAAGCSLRTVARWMKIHGIETPTAAEKSKQRGTRFRPPSPALTCQCGTPKSRYARTCAGCYDKSGERNPKFRGDRIGVGMAHQRVAALHGKATEHDCVNCGSTAAHWAYDHEDPDERLSEDGPYSVDPAHYMPMCVRCHKRFDLAYSRGVSA